MLEVKVIFEFSNLTDSLKKRSVIDTSLINSYINPNLGGLFRVCFVVVRGITPSPPAPLCLKLVRITLET